jgi:hypothetical protein
MTLLHQACQYVLNDGFSVFPLVYRDKVPFRRWPWKTLQTRKPSESELTAWFAAGPVNLAVVTGPVSGQLLVLDFDDLDVFAVWHRLTGLESRTVTTGKGCHVYLRCREGFNGDFYVDGRLGGQARYAGGYVVAPPSVHPSGSVYRWSFDGPLLTVERSALQVTPTQERLGPTFAPSPKAPGQRYTPGRGVKDAVKYAETALERECQTVRQAVEHTRNNTLFRCALKMKKHADTLGAERVFSALLQAGVDVGLSESEARKAVVNAWHVARY